MKNKIRFFLGALFVGVCSLALSFNNCKCVKKEISAIEIGISPINVFEPYDGHNFTPVVRVVYMDGEKRDTKIKYIGSMIDFDKRFRNYKSIQIEDESFEEVKNAITEYESLDIEYEDLSKKEDDMPPEECCERYKHIFCEQARCEELVLEKLGLWNSLI